MILEDEEGFINLVLAIDKVSKKQEGGYAIECRGMFREQTVGVCCLIKDEIMIRSLGDCSDTFIKILVKLYGALIKQPKLIIELEVDVASLKGTIRNLSSEIVKLKFF